jgi:hypothetical protein
VANISLKKIATATGTGVLDEGCFAIAVALDATARYAQIRTGAMT